MISKQEASRIDTNKIGVVLYFKDSALVTKNGLSAIYKKYKPKYKFSDFKIANIYKGRLAEPILLADSKEYNYRTVIRESCKSQGVNFAGHYTIAIWGCGTECANMAIVDRITGEVYIDFSFQNGSTASEGEYGELFQKDSNLIIINSSLTDIIPGYQRLSDYMKPEFYEWTGNGLKKLN
jgi:hypothetical protein